MLRFTLLLNLLWLLSGAALAASPWQLSLQERLETLEQGYPGEFAIYVQHIASGETLSWRAAENWYLASMVKVPVALEVFRLVDLGEISLQDMLTVTADVYVDGAGETNWQKPGSEVSVAFLLEQMLTVSDNTASDMLIRYVSINGVNRRVRDMLPAGADVQELGPITSLVDVRRLAYGQLHPRASELTGTDFIELRKVPDLPGRTRSFMRRLGLKESDLLAKDIDSAFAAYYATPYNSGRLSTFGQLLITLATGEALSENSTAELLAIMERTRSGERRLKAGLPAGWAFAHKTGTQHRRTCDGGILRLASPPAQAHGKGGLVIVACTRGPLSSARSEEALADIGRAITASGVLTLANELPASPSTPVPGTTQR